jgi:hypothetical protein
MMPTNGPFGMMNNNFHQAKVLEVIHVVNQKPQRQQQQQQK